MLKPFILLINLLLAASVVAADDNKSPILIHSSTVKFNDKDGTALYKGKVVAEQGRRRLYSDTLTIYRGEDNNIQKMIAKGDLARIKSMFKNKSTAGLGRAKVIKYYPRKDMVELIGNAELEKNGEIIRGPFLVYYFTTGILFSKPVKSGRTTVVLPAKVKKKG